MNRVWPEDRRQVQELIKDENVAHQSRTRVGTTESVALINTAPSILAIVNIAICPLDSV